MIGVVFHEGCEPWGWCQPENHWCQPWGDGPYGFTTLKLWFLWELRIKIWMFFWGLNRDSPWRKHRKTWLEQPWDQGIISVLSILSTFSMFFFCIHVLFRSAYFQEGHHDPTKSCRVLSAGEGHQRSLHGQGASVLAGFIQVKWYFFFLGRPAIFTTFFFG